jgi:glycerate 2-kinase
MDISFAPTTALESDLPASARECALATLTAALHAVDPAEAVRHHCSLRGDTLQVGASTYDLRHYEHIYVVGMGKASADMAVALEGILGERISAGWVNVKDGYTAPARIVTLHEARHPLPYERGVEGSRRIAALAHQAGPNDLLFCLISGGVSALMSLPVESITLVDLETLTRLSLIHI